VEMPIQVLIDEDHCEEVSKAMKAMNGGNAKWQGLNAHPDVGPLLPDRRGIYMFCWEPPLVFEFETKNEQRRFDWCLYIGKASISIRKRFESEYKKYYIKRNPRLLYKTKEEMGRPEKLQKYLCLHLLKIWYLTVNDESLIEDMEDKLICLLNPPLNTQKKKIRGHFRKAEAAF